MRGFVFALILMGTSAVLYAQRAKEIDQLLTVHENAHQFSGSVLVAEKGKIIFEKSYGYSNAEKGQKNTNNTRYRIYSTTKIFTAAVIVKLEEQGKLSLDDKLSKYFPGFVKGDSITIKNLLSHTSGIPQAAEGSEYTVDEATLLKALSGKPLDFSPGKGWNYSNSNYYLLGYIIQKVTGMEYDKAIETFILKPLQMTNSGFHFNDLQHADKALGYEFMAGRHSNEALRFKTDHPFAAGAMYATVGDLYTFSEAFYKGKIVGKDAVRSMYTPYLNDHYGFGQEIYKVPGAAKVLVGHSGGAPGYRCRFIRDVDNDIAIILLVNSEMIPIDKITENITSIVYWQPYQKTSIGAVHKEELQNIEGIYSSPETTFYVTIIDGTVVFQESNYPRVPLIPVSKNLFALKENFTFKFHTGTNGKVDSLTLTHPGGSKTTKKIANTFPWGIIGSATPGGWDGKDLVMLTQKDKPGFYYLKRQALKAGELRFRLNNDWSSSMGLNNDGKSVAFDGYNIDIKEDGLYDIVLDMTVRTRPTYSIMPAGK